MGCFPVDVHQAIPSVLKTLEFKRVLRAPLFSENYHGGAESAKVHPIILLSVCACGNYDLQSSKDK